MTDNPLNCWEFLKCGREPGGAKVADEGVCPAATALDFDGRNGGLNGGRACFCITDTLCTGEPGGSFVEKLTGCIKCDFYRVLEDQDDLMQLMMLNQHFDRR